MWLKFIDNKYGTFSFFVGFVVSTLAVIALKIDNEIIAGITLGALAGINYAFALCRLFKDLQN